MKLTPLLRPLEFPECSHGWLILPSSAFPTSKPRTRADPKRRVAAEAAG
jgi:hypothetical protein